MGYNAYTVEVDFTIPADKVPAALAALNASLTDDDEGDGEPGGYTTLAEAFAQHAGFEGCDDPGDHINYDGFGLGWYPSEKYSDDYVEPLLSAVAPFAKEGSYVRFQGEDDCLWGWRVVDGRLHEVGVVTWHVAEAITGGAESPPAEKTWTFFGHWDDDTLAIEYYVEGEQEDTREDTGFWEQGLWAASATGATVEEAQAKALAEYEGSDEDEEDGE